MQLLCRAHLGLLLRLLLKVILLEVGRPLLRQLLGPGPGSLVRVLLGLLSPSGQLTVRLHVLLQLQQQ